MAAESMCVNVHSQQNFLLLRLSHGWVQSLYTQRPVLLEAGISRVHKHHYQFVCVNVHYQQTFLEVR